MRALATIALAAAMSAAGCMDSGPEVRYPPGGGDPGWDGPPMGTTCMVATDCASGQVCARDHECLDPSQARSVLVHWTILGATPDATSCAQVGVMSIEYSDSATGQLTGFSPLMCTAGQFFVDIWPAHYDQTAIDARVGSSNALHGAATLPPGNAEVTVDLVP
jgi:hypothetical protein